MKWFFDTSVLVPVFLADHVHHDRSVAAFKVADRRTGCCAAYSLAEFFAAFTRLPAPYRASGEQVLLFLELIKQRLTIVSLTGEEYMEVIRRAAEEGILGGTIYDAILAGCALKAMPETIYTWNERHFRWLGREIAVRVRTP
ncbi:MAG TPA: PIN domain-containing protein [Candidatus Sulfotelmatobacter sp.]